MQASAALFEGVVVDASNPATIKHTKKWLLRTLPQDTISKKETYTKKSAQPPPLYGISIASSSAECFTATHYIKTSSAYWTNGCLQLVLDEVPVAGSGEITKYEVFFTQGTDGVQLVGKAADGLDFLRLQQCVDNNPTTTSNVDRLEVSLFCGAAVPAAELADFMIPSNPCEWVLLRCGPKLHVGVGYFLSADVPDEPTLLFHLDVDTKDDSEPNAFTITKKYEQSRETDGYEVIYSGVFKAACSQATPSLTGNSWHTGHVPSVLYGDWVNDKAFTKGSFLCTESPVPLPREGAPPAVVFCSELQAWRPIGTLLVAPLLKPLDETDTSALHIDEQKLVCFDAAFPDTAETVLTTVEKLRGGSSIAELLPFCFTCFYFPPVFAQDVEKKSCRQIVVEGLSGFGSRRLLAMCANGQRSGLKEFSYRNVGDLVEALLQTPPLQTLCNDRPHSREGKYCFVVGPTNAANTSIALLAAVAAGCIAVPVPQTLTKEATEELICTILQSSARDPPQYCVLVSEAYNLLGDASQHTPVMDMMKTTKYEGACVDVEAALTNSSSQGGSSLLAMHAKLLDDPANKDVIVDVSPVAILFTSGTSGNVPKGVPFGEELARPSEGQAHIAPFVQLDMQPHDPTYILSLLQTIFCGGERLIAPTIAAIFDTIEVGHPTHIGAPPSFWSGLADEYVAEVDRLGNNEKAKVAAKNAVLNRLGKRAKVLTSGGGYMAASTQSILKDAVGLDVVSLYGCREVGGIARNGHVHPGVVVRIRNESGAIVSCGVGECLVHSPRMTSGYISASSQAYVVDDTSEKRFYCTGDQVDLKTKPDGTQFVVVLGRKANTLKLSSGQWVSTDEIESVLESSCPDVRQAAVFPASDDSALPLSAVIVCQEISTELKQILKNPKLIEEKIVRIIRHCQTAKPLPREALPIHFCFVSFEEFSFTDGNGMLTGSRKKKTSSIRAFFRDGPWHNVQHQDDDDNENAVFVHELLRPLLPKRVDGSMRQQLGPRMQNLLGCSLAELGADSIFVMRLIAACKRQGLAAPSPEEAFGWTLGGANGVLCGSSPTLHQMPTPNDMDWHTELQLPAEIQRALETLNSQTSPVASRAKNFILIGATGFLGPLILAELLQRLLSPSMYGGRIMVVGRGNGTKERVLQSLKKLADSTVFNNTHNPSWNFDLKGLPKAAPEEIQPVPPPPHLPQMQELLKDERFLNERLVFSESDFNAIAEGEGDGYRTLGLVKEEFNSVLKPLLEEGVQALILNAAKVSHVAPYAALKRSNVLLPTNVALFCGTFRIPLTFVSSTAALPAGTPTSSTHPFNAIDEEHLKSKASSDGYGATKAVAEALIALVANAVHLPVHFIRPCAVSPPSSSSEAAALGSQGDMLWQNPTDGIQLLLEACFQLGEDQRPVFPDDVQLEFHTVPVDFVASVIATCACQRGPTHGVHQYNVANVGPDLKDLVEAVCGVACGHTVPMATFRGLIQARFQQPPDDRNEEEESRRALVGKRLVSFGWSNGARYALPCLETTRMLMGGDGAINPTHVPPLCFAPPQAFASCN